MREQVPGTQYVRADDVHVGDTAVEADGYPLPVIEVRRERGCIVIVCRCDGPVRGTPSCRVRPSTMVRIETRKV